MKIGIFTHNWPHKKTYEGVMRLIVEGYKIDCMIGRNPVDDLGFYQSKIRISPKGLMYPDPKQIAERFNIPYYILVHNSEETRRIIQKMGLDIGIILGARILKDYIIDSFNIGILNLHPGILPEVRGLDCHKWAILKDLPQGVTAHLIDKRIDRGKIIKKQIIDVYKDDTLLDIFLRIQNLEQSLMIESLNMTKNGFRPKITIEQGNYFKSVPDDLEKELLNKFIEYKNNYDVIKSDYNKLNVSY